MRQRSRPLPLKAKAALRRIFDPRVLFVASVFAVIVSLFVLRAMDPADGTWGQVRLTSPPSPFLEQAVRARVQPDALGFEDALVESILTDRRVTVTVHVALLDRPPGRAGSPLADGANPKHNMHWGALFGMETHFANAAGWRRAYTDDGDGRGIIRRVVFHRTAAPTTAWQARGVTAAFEVYVLANAWPSDRIVDAMEQPLRDALCGEPVRLRVDGPEPQALEFGGGSLVVGYLGRNHMLEEYWDPFAQLGQCHARRQVGVFYACSRSAVVLHAPVVEHGLYSILFTRSTITPEAYVVDGMLMALLSGELGDALLSAAAAEYARYQKSVSYGRALSMLFR